MSAGFHRLGTSVPSKVTGYHHLSLPVGVIVAGLPLLPMGAQPPSALMAHGGTLTIEELAATGHAPPARPADDLRAIARAGGFSGDECTTCGHMQMRRTGTCLTCASCGATTSCA